MSYDFLPGTQVVTVDGGLAQKRTPQSKSTIILGVSGKGRTDEAYRVVDRASAADEFGFEGNLIQAMEEVAQGGCDNIYLFRMGTSPASLANIGGVKQVGSGAASTDTLTSAGLTVTFGHRDANVHTDYRVYFDSATGILDVFFKGNLVYSNNPADLVDTAEVTVEGTLDPTHPGMDLIAAGSQITDSHFVQSISFSDAVALVDGTRGAAASYYSLAPVNVEAELGLAMTVTQTYEAQQRAFELLEIFPIQRVFCPAARFDAPNVAYATSSADLVNTPTSAGKALGWLKTWRDADGMLQFHWAHLANAADIATPGVQTFVSHTTRLAAGFHEVSFPYQLARFCRKQSQNQGGCFGYIGFNEPKSYKPRGLRDFIGFLPTVDTAGAVITAGKGLCGTALLAGTPSGSLNPLVHDISAKAYRAPGLFQTAGTAFPGEDGEYDEGPIVDRNGYPVDIGAHIHAVGEWAFVRNSAGTYRANLAGVICGFEANLDPKSAITNKALPGVIQLYRVTLSQLNALTKAKVNMLRFKGDGVAPALLHDYTCSTDASDYIFIMRQNVKFLLCSALFQEADKFIGESSTDGLQLAALRTALDRRVIDLKKRGYIAECDYTIYSTNADRRIGRAFIDITFNPPDEAVQIRASIAIGRN